MEKDIESLASYGLRIIEDVKSRQEGLDYLRQIIENIDNSNKNLKKNLDDTNQKNLNLENECEMLKRVSAELKNKYNELENEYEELTNDNYELDSNYNKLENEYNNQKSNYDELKKKYEILKKELSLKSEQISNLNCALKEKNNMINKLDFNLVEEKKKNEEKDEKINSLKAQISGLQSDKEQGKVINEYLEKIRNIENSLNDLFKNIKNEVKGSNKEEENNYLPTRSDYKNQHEISNNSNEGISDRGNEE